MKKWIASIAMGATLFGISFTSVAAEEYEIVKGDNLWNIAMDNDTTVEYLVDVNNLETTVIHPKQKIIVNHIYTVEKGDTLSSVAEEYDIDIKEVKEWNDLESNVLYVGQELVVYDLDLDPKEREELRAKVKTEEKKETTPKKAETATTKKAEVTAPKKEEAATPKKAETTSTEDKVEGKTITVEATAYTAKCDGCSGITYTGVDLNSNPNAKVIAVDPNVIPLGTEVYVEGYGHAVAEDIGGAIKGNRIDIHVPTKDEAYSWGRRTVEVTILD